MDHSLAGQLVQVDPKSKLGGDPAYRGKLATVVSVDGRKEGQGDRNFVTLRFHASGKIETAFSADLLVLA